MSDDAYYDAGAGAWRRGDEWLGERREDDATDAPEWREDDETPPEPAEEQDGNEEAADREERPDVDPLDDDEFRRAAREHREMSGRVVSHGRRRGNHPTGFRGQGVRGLRVGSGDRTPNASIRPTGRQLGPRSLPVGSPGYEDAPALVRRLLGRRRIAVLRAGLKTKGASIEERQARVYLAVMLCALDVTAANAAAAELLFEDAATDKEAREKALRTLGDLRGRLRHGEYRQAEVAKAQRELAERVRPKTT